MELIVDRRVIASSKGSRKDFFFIGIWLEGFTNYSIIVQTLWVILPPLAIVIAKFY
jgi:hypothetical protein